MNLQEFLKDLAKKAKVDEQSEDFQMIISASALKEVEMPIDVINTINQNFLTRDAALNDNQIYDKHKNRVYKNINSIIFENSKDLNLDDDFLNEIKNETSGANAFNKFFDNLKKTQISNKKDPKNDISEKEELYKRQIEELNNEIINQKSKVEETISNYRNRDMQKEFMNKIFEFDIADNVPGGKKYLANATFEELKNQYHIDYNEDSGFSIKQKNNPDLDAFVDNRKVGLDDILKQKLEPFIRKSPPKQDGKPTFNTPASEKPKFAEGSLKAIAHQRFLDDARKVSQQN